MVQPVVHGANITATIEALLGEQTELPNEPEYPNNPITPSTTVKVYLHGKNYDQLHKSDVVQLSVSLRTNTLQRIPAKHFYAGYNMRIIS
ncbi:hypothetical protein HY485_05505 [Candidatus Woesearchaeota archaeon]|nr:hypothetical protein [Candidatus Woesearchaeota archaeon]